MWVGKYCIQRASDKTQWGTVNKLGYIKEEEFMTDWGPDSSGSEQSIMKQ